MPPPAGTMPRLTSVRPIVALSDAMRMSGALHEFRARGQAEAVDRRDNGLVERKVAKERRSRDFRLAAKAFVPLVLRRTSARHQRDQPRQIGAGAERLVARTRDDGHTHLVIVLEIDPGISQSDHHLRIDGVPFLRTVQRDPGDMATLFVQQYICHECSPYSPSFIRSSNSASSLGRSSSIGSCSRFAITGTSQRRTKASSSASMLR